MATRVLWRERFTGRIISENINGILRVTSFKPEDPSPIPPPPTYNPTHYVARDGSDSGDGSEDHPWQTIAKANRTLTAGNVLAIKAGTYDDYIEPENSGTAGKPIVYMAHGQDRVVVAGKPTAGKLCQMQQDYIVALNLDFCYAHGKVDGGDWPWVDISSSTGCVVYGCKIHRDSNTLKEVGIQVASATRTTIENCEIYGMKIGIKIKNKPRFTVVRGCNVHDCSFHTLSFGQGGFIIQGTLIEYNVFDHTGADGCQVVNPKYDPSFDYENNADPDVDTRGIIIRGNVFRHNGENALDLKASRYIIVEGNVIYGTIGSGGKNGVNNLDNRNVLGSITRGQRTTAHDVVIRRNRFFDTCQPTRFFGGETAEQNEGIKIYNNTFVGCNRDFTGYDSQWESDGIIVGHVALRQQGGSKAIRCAFVNNIVVGQNTAMVALKLGSGAGQYYDYNLYYNSKGEKFAHMSNSSWTGKSFSGWKSAMSDNPDIGGKEAHSLSGTDPKFVNAPERPNYEKVIEDESKVKQASDLSQYLDFRIGENSKAIDAGGPLAFAENSGNNSNRLDVDDATWFCDGFGIAEGDMIRIAGGPEVQVAQVDYDKNVLTLEEPRTWNKGAQVYMDYRGDAPDIGFWESGYG